eukprot:2149187-Amphidinium_carterae.1
MTASPFSSAAFTPVVRSPSCFSPVFLSPLLSSAAFTSVPPAALFSLLRTHSSDHARPALCCVVS